MDFYQGKNREYRIPILGNICQLLDKLELGLILEVD